MLWKADVNEYQAPKWRVRCLFDDRAFIHNDKRIFSLWELREFLLSALGETISSELINNIANWVEHIIGHVRLAKAMRETSSKWELLVVMEKIMMKTLFVPDYVAKKWLTNSLANFTVRKGPDLQNLEDLRQGLENENTETMKHLQKYPDDFVIWLETSVGDYLLADEMREATNKRQRYNLMVGHIEELEKAQHIRMS